MIYLDNAATTRLDRRVGDAMAPFGADRFGNPSSLHALGAQAERALFDARDAIAGALTGDRRRVVFTSGGSEANALALLGLCPRGRRNHAVLSPIEHPSVYDQIEILRERGCEVTVVPMGPSGVVDAQDVQAALTERTALVAVMHASNEIGTVQPIAEIARRVHERDDRIVVHADAVQSAAYEALDDLAAADSIAIAAHKLHGPKGAGALVLGSVVSPRPLWKGGDQEGGLRAGTQNVAGAVGLAAALSMARAEAAAVRARLGTLRDRLIAQASSGVSGVTLVGSASARLAGHVALAVEGAPSERLLHALEARGVVASAGSACHARRKGHARAFAAVGVPEHSGALRLTLSRETTEAEIEQAIGAFEEAVREVRGSAARTGA